MSCGAMALTFAILSAGAAAAGPPQVTEVAARDATQSTVTIEAKIDPNGLATSYHFEWGSSAEYGADVPADIEGFVGSGTEPVTVTAKLTALAAGTAYHYRVVATNSAGPAAVRDQILETLNSCGLTDGRCFELVSRADKGPLASPGQSMSAAGIHFQAAPSGSALAYTVAFGYPDATEGFAVTDLARRDPSGWSSDQLTPPLVTPPVFAGPGGGGGAVKALSSDLGCGVVASLAPLAPGASASLVEAGGRNLYRRDATGSYRAITTLSPVDPELGPSSNSGAGEYLILGMSPDCERVVFRTRYTYPGIPAVRDSKSQLYEWAQGTIRNVAMIPGPGGTAEPVPAESLPGAMDEALSSPAPIGAKDPTDYWHAVSTSAARSVFTAISRFGADSGERAIFLRDADDPAVLAGTAPATDISQSETATPNDGNSRFWTASADGRRVFFTARYGLAANASSSGASACSNEPRGGVATGSGAGCDLYEYDADAPLGERLADLTADTVDPGGAGVAGVLDTSEDGTYVYLAARGRLGVAGRSEAENLASATYNVYLVHAGAAAFVGVIGATEAVGRNGGALVNTPSSSHWTSRATPDGGTLAFESSLGGLPGASPGVYLFRAADGDTVCASCRHDGRPPFTEHALTPLIEPGAIEGAAVQKNLTGNGRLYFYSFDPLAAGAVEGDRNLYQWEHGQVSLIATEPESVPRSLTGSPISLFFGDASADGTDVYFTSPLALVGTDRDERWDVYDARVGGGFPEPAAPTLPCDATVEGACNSGAANVPAAVPPATSGFVGPANPAVTQHKHKKKHKHHRRKHRHHRKKGKHGKREKDRRHGKQRHKHAAKAGRADGDRGAAK
jgi:hypothetical protein